MSMDRRRFLAGASALAVPLVGGLAGCRSSPPRARAAALPGEALNDRVRVITGAPGNVVAVSTGDGVVLVDSGSAALAPGVRASLDGARVHTLFNTHHHADQTGGNLSFGAAGATIHAHEITREWLETDYYVPAEDRWVKALPAAALPTATFRTTGAATIGAEHIEYGYLLEAHTRGDIYVHLRDANILCAGDVASPLRDPVIDWYAGGWLGGRVDAMDALLARADAATRIVPAYGAVMTRAALSTERDMMLKLFERTGNLTMEGYSAQDLLEAGVLNDLGRTFTDPNRLLYDVCKSLWAHYTNFGGRSV
jgi:glyoxylase-like metal-dependent hydrolase (beta-lactamase superfamily II)